MDKKKLLMMVEIAIFGAIGIVLDQFSFTLWAQGGSISFVMVPIMLMAIRWGLPAGLATGPYYWRITNDVWRIYCALVTGDFRLWSSLYSSRIGRSNS